MHRHADIGALLLFTRFNFRWRLTLTQHEQLDCGAGKRRSIILFFHRIEAIKFTSLFETAANICIVWSV